MTGIIYKYCHKQIMSLEFHIVAKFANQHYTFNTRGTCIMSFVF